MLAAAEGRMDAVEYLTQKGANSVKQLIIKGTQPY
jgi:hypothetical protein